MKLSGGARHYSRKRPSDAAAGLHLPQKRASQRRSVSQAGSRLLSPALGISGVRPPFCSLPVVLPFRHNMQAAFVIEQVHNMGHVP